MNQGSIRFAIVGCGTLGAGLARILQGMNRSTVTAVYGGSGAGALAAELDCDSEESLDGLLRRRDVDAVIVATPNYVHRDPIVLAAEHGKHVFCENPAALSLKDCRDMLEACRTAGVRLMVGDHYYFMKGVQQVRQWVASGVIGRPIAIHAERTDWEHPLDIEEWKRNPQTSGGHVFHRIHEIDLLQTIMGRATAVCAAGGNPVHREEAEGPGDDVLLLTLQFEGGTVGSVQYGSGFRWGEHYIKINGTDGAVLIDMKKPKVYLRKNDKVTQYLLNYTKEEDEERARFYRNEGTVVTPQGKWTTVQPRYMVRMLEQEMAVFRDAVLGLPVKEHLQALFDGTSAASTVATAEAALISLREKRWVQIE